MNLLVARKVCLSLPEVVVVNLLVAQKVRLSGGCEFKSGSEGSSVGRL